MKLAQRMVAIFDQVFTTRFTGANVQNTDAALRLRVEEDGVGAVF